MDTPEDIITMDNGCVCCSIRGDLIRTLGQLAARRKEFDAIILEVRGERKREWEGEDLSQIATTYKFSV